MLSSTLNLLFLIVLSEFACVDAAINQPNEQQTPDPNRQNPLRFSIFGYPAAMRVKTWYFENERPAIVSTSYASINLYCSDELMTGGGTRFKKTLVLGSWSYNRPSTDRPSSIITFDEGETAHTYSGMFPFCIRRIDEYDTLLKRLLRKYNNKMISFWFDLTTPINGEEMTTHPIGEMTVGGMNPARFTGTATKIKIAMDMPSNYPSSFWIPERPLAISVGNKRFNRPLKVMFDLEDDNVVPYDLFDAITAPLKAELKYTVGLMKGMPRDTNKKIMSYLDLDKPIDVFDCKDSSKLLPLRVGPITITPQMMYKKISDEKCTISLVRSDIPGFNDDLVIGMDIISQFYFSIQYDSQNGDSILFSTRKEGELFSLIADEMAEYNEQQCSSPDIANRKSSCAIA